MRSKLAPWSAAFLALMMGIVAIGLWIWMSGPRTGPAERTGPDTGSVNFIIPTNELEAYRQRATAGDNRAAASLSYHYAELGRGGEERRWLTLAASRGDCNSMDLLKWMLAEGGDRAGARRWNDMLRRNACTLAKTDRQLGLLNSTAGETPLWDD